MQHIRWKFFFLGILVALISLIVFFQNFNGTTPATWQFLFSKNMFTFSGVVSLFGFVCGFLTALFFFMAVKGGRYDPKAQGKEHPDTWERVADQY